MAGEPPPGPPSNSPHPSNPPHPSNSPHPPEPPQVPSDLPPEAAGRLTSRAFSSGLSVNDFAACLHMGIQPVALVQGYCVTGWSWYGAATPYAYRAGYGNTGGYGRGGSGGFGGYGGGRYGGGYSRGGGYPGTAGGGIGGPFGGGAASRGPGPGYRGAGTLSTYSCPHYYAGMDHRTWGENFEQTWLAQAWNGAFNTAYHRMLEEAREAGAHGVIGVVDRSSELVDRSVREFHVYGTAVVVEGEPPPAEIWTSYLSGQRLAKLVESGYMPRSIVASMASVRMWAVCVTEMLMRGGYQMGGPVLSGVEVTQLADAQMQGRRLVRDQVKAAIGKDSLYGADLQASLREVGEGDVQVDCVLRGTRVHRYRPADPLPPPRLTVRAND